MQRKLGTPKYFWLRQLRNWLHRGDLLKWSSLSKFYKSRGVQIISLLPALGYFILWSDSFPSQPTK